MFGTESIRVCVSVRLIRQPSGVSIVRRTSGTDTCSAEATATGLLSARRVAAAMPIKVRRDKFGHHYFCVEYGIRDSGVAERSDGQAGNQVLRYGGTTRILLQHSAFTVCAQLSLAQFIVWLS